MAEVEQHPFEPFLPENAKLLMLGSFPPQPKRWSMDFYYPNFTNDMWRIMGLIYYADKNHFIVPGQKTFQKDLLISFLKEQGIALYDSATAIRRLQDNASDKFLEVVTPTDIDALLSQLPHCQAIVTTGEKATDTLCEKYDAEKPKVGHYSPFQYQGRELRLYRMPSSSRAYPLALEKKAAVYAHMLQELEMIKDYNS
ncbi:MAG: uracil-DNA glycosylase family protein [Bacteroidaceae bacterium]|nr:uracil-DNA glycosylase family protein [Bacteroidaceae bacterium]